MSFTTQEDLEERALMLLLRHTREWVLSACRKRRLLIGTKDLDGLGGGLSQGRPAASQSRPSYFQVPFLESLLFTPRAQAGSSTFQGGRGPFKPLKGVNDTHLFLAQV